MAMIVRHVAENQLGDGANWSVPVAYYYVSLVNQIGIDVLGLDLVRIGDRCFIIKQIFFG